LVRMVRSPTAGVFSLTRIVARKPRRAAVAAAFSF